LAAFVAGPATVEQHAVTGIIAARAGPRQNPLRADHPCRRPDLMPRNDLTSNQERPPSAIDLFAGAGGLSLGLRAAGFAVEAAVESGRDAVASYRAHHPGAVVIQGDIATVDFEALNRRFAIVAAGPPCQPFSVGGKRLAADDPRNGIPQLLRAVAALRPRAVVMENVAGLAATSKRPYLDSVVVGLEDMGYSTTWRVLQAADYGVPQNRERLFLVGVLGTRFVFPPPTHGPLTGRAHTVAASVIDPEHPLGELNTAIVTYARRPSLRPGAYHGHLYNGGGRPIQLSQPAPTMLASMGGNKTPWVDTLGIVPGYHTYLLTGGAPRRGKVPGARRITVDEAALIQGFPVGTMFAGRRSSQYRQIGNAVPPVLAERVGLALRTQLFG
jgi:DNA (cytosine-5)-methyltransferase 1